LKVVSRTSMAAAIARRLLVANSMQTFFLLLLLLATLVPGAAAFGIAVTSLFHQQPAIIFPSPSMQAARGSEGGRSRKGALRMADPWDVTGRDSAEGFLPATDPFISATEPYIYYADFCSYSWFISAALIRRQDCHELNPDILSLLLTCPT